MKICNYLKHKTYMTACCSEQHHQKYLKNLSGYSKLNHGCKKHPTNGIFTTPNDSVHFLFDKFQRLTKYFAHDFGKERRAWCSSTVAFYINHPEDDLTLEMVKNRKSGDEEHWSGPKTNDLTYRSGIYFRENKFEKTHNNSDSVH